MRKGFPDSKGTAMQVGRRGGRCTWLRRPAGGTTLLWCRRMGGERWGSRGDGTAFLTPSFAPHSLSGETPQPLLRGFALSLLIRSAARRRSHFQEDSPFRSSFAQRRDAAATFKRIRPFAAHSRSGGTPQLLSRGFALSQLIRSAARRRSHF
jgi:hypothetical protein